ncbi:MAG: hypothetical protein J6M24_04165 [Lachnospiraceae bacterium]|nr:hypothetical protein [Lachnospiraceae bacterium]
MTKAKYTEPTDYIPEEIRKKYIIGEYAENEENNDSEKESRDYKENQESTKK